MFDFIKEVVGPPEGRIDFVLVVDASRITPDKMVKVKYYIRYLQDRGLQCEQIKGNVDPNLIFITIHLPKKALLHFASVYNIDTSNRKHVFIPERKATCTSCFETKLTLDDENVYKKKGNVASTTERILVVVEILNDALFGEGEDMYGFEKLLRIGALEAAYPLHDGQCHYDKRSPDEDLNDRQLLYKYWANFSLKTCLKRQPINLIEKYFGSEVAFYFGWCGFYNQMLIIPSVVGLCCFLANIALLYAQTNYRVDEICNSSLMMCPVCHYDENCLFKPLNSSCSSSQIAFMFDTETTVVFAVFMSFWATIFVYLWQRLENVLKVKWNVEFVDSDTKIRLQYKEKAVSKRISVVTKEEEPYIPTFVNVMYLTLSYGLCLLLVSVVLLAICGIITFRITLDSIFRRSSEEYLKTHSTIITLSTSCTIQVIFIKIFGKFYGVLSEWLTYLENPRTQSEFDNSVIHKRYFLGFANNYAPLMYIAFFKGRFFTPQHKTMFYTFASDQCHPSGCFMALCIQVAFLLLLKSLVGNILTLIIHLTNCNCKKKPVDTTITTQFEKEFGLRASGRYLLTTEFMEMIIQFGFVTFFVAAFPLAPLCALINNILELRLDAYKLVRSHRRPIPRKQAGIGAWNGILMAISLLSTATNAFVLAFTSDFVARLLYSRKSGSLEGYVISTLSLFDMRDHEMRNVSQILQHNDNSTLCFYPAHRNPPTHPHKYLLTSYYWYELGMRLACVIIFEHVILISKGLLSYVIPSMPVSVKESLNHEMNRERDLKLQLLSEKFNRGRRRRKITKQS